MRKIFHILNPSARHRAAVAAVFSRNPVWPHRWVNREGHPTHLETLADWAQLEGFTDLVLWGGDGSFSRLIQALLERDLLSTIGVSLVPVGTCNDFARASGLMWKNAEAVLKSQEPNYSLVDLGVVQSGHQKRIFMNNAGFGRSQRRSHLARPRPLHDIFTLTPTPVSVEIETSGVPIRQQLDVLFFTVFNGPYFSGGLRFSAPTKCDDGVLNATAVFPQSPFRLLGSLLMGRLGFSLRGRHLKEWTANNIHVTSVRDLYFQADGEPAFRNPVRSVSIYLKPKAVRLWLPAREGVVS